MSEIDNQNKIRVALSEAGATTWRNNQGAYKAVSETGKEYYIKYGVANPGGSDLIGLYSMTITPEMVGNKVAVFFAFEVKDKGKPTKEQQNFIDFVNNAGGIAGWGTCEEDALELLK